MNKTKLRCQIFRHYLPNQAETGCGSSWCESTLSQYELLTLLFTFLIFNLSSINHLLLFYSSLSWEWASLKSFKVSPFSTPLGPCPICVPLMRAVTFWVHSRILHCCAHLSHRRKQNSQKGVFPEQTEKKFNKALFSTYNCMQWETFTFTTSLIVCKINPTHDQTLILGGFTIIMSQRRNKHTCFTEVTKWHLCFLFCYSFLSLLSLSLWNTQDGGHTGWRPHRRRTTTRFSGSHQPPKISWRSSTLVSLVWNPYGGRLAFIPLRPLLWLSSKPHLSKQRPGSRYHVKHFKHRDDNIKD